jgi:hypothetical protein
MEKLDYFLFMKKKYENILQNLIGIHNTYQEILESDIVKSRYLEYEIKSKNECNKQIDEIKYYIKQIEIEISQRCEHQFIEDEIDITPDRSQKIKYCSICEYTCSSVRL